MRPEDSDAIPPLPAEKRLFGLVQDNTISAERVERYIDDTVGYTPPIDLPIPLWQRSAEDERLFRLENVGSLASWRSLRELRDELHSSPVRDDSRLDELDGLAGQLLKIATLLHSQGQWLGLISPEGVRVRRGTNGRELALPDLGFYWSGTLYPEGASAALAEFKDLWGGRNRWYPLETAAKEDAPRDDVRVLGRLFAAVLLAGGAWRFLKEIPDVEQEASLEAPCWYVLARTVNGQMETADELARLLEQYPLSGHFRQKPTRRRRWPLVAAGVLLAATAATVWPWWHRPPTATSGEPTVRRVERLPPRETLSPEIAVLWDRVQQARNSDQQFDTLLDILEQPQPSDAVARQALADLAEYLRGQLLRNIRREIAVASQAGADRRKDPDSDHRLRTLRAWLRSLVAFDRSSPPLREEERQCLVDLESLLTPLPD